MVLKEVQTQNRSDGPLQRRWFTDNQLDLYVWEDENGEIVKFQLCYQLAGEYAFTWDCDEGFSHHGVDDGESHPSRNATPLLVADGDVNKQVLSALLFGRARDLDPGIYQFIADKITEYETI